MQAPTLIIFLSLYFSGTAEPETIGRTRSHGCIRLANWDAIRLPNLIRPGTTVEIR